MNFFLLFFSPKLCVSTTGYDDGNDDVLFWKNKSSSNKVMSISDKKKKKHRNIESQILYWHGRACSSINLINWLYDRIDRKVMCIEQNIILLPSKWRTFSTQSGICFSFVSTRILRKNKSWTCQTIVQSH